ncbi:TetR/AcrR family transcriptional regulator [Microbacterium arborescens]|uniref:TetR/AcrR family transcriptional regulator n=1 Tax=Microbacterium arborescens TaxID=33883 RepID=UPI002785D6E6|nr:TetR family transcriptional regulator [Microbacterium arborescens]MDQ1218280.1 AcrR family transcriptional regulator [Microbacterium arborescens]
MCSDDSSTPTAKGRRSREAILRAAAVRFESDGFDRATVRGIARDAGIDAAMIVRYFGSKESLFLAATSIDLELPRVDTESELGPGQALARHAVALWGSETPGRALRILLRASAQDAEAAVRVRDVFATQVSPFLAGEQGDSPVRASLITSQILGYALGRYIIGLDPLVDVDDEEAARRLGVALQALIDAP